MENPQMLHQIRNGSVKECEVEMVGEECEVDVTAHGQEVGHTYML